MAEGLSDVTRLLAAPVSGLSQDGLIEAVGESEKIRLAARERTGRLLAELHSRGLSWPAIAKATGMRQTTAYDIGRPYVADD